MRYVAMRGMFAVRKENILHIDRKVYLNLLESLSVGDNIENGHFAERIWAHLFRQYSFDTIEPVVELEVVEPAVELEVEPVVVKQEFKPSGILTRAFGLLKF